MDIDGKIRKEFNRYQRNKVTDYKQEVKALKSDLWKWQS